MGIEPTFRFWRNAGFEDQEAHQDSFTSINTRHKVTEAQRNTVQYLLKAPFCVPLPLFAFVTILGYT